MGAPFVDLSTDSARLLRMLRELRLADADESPRVQTLSGGVSSNIVSVELRRGPVCVKQALPKLKVDKDWRVPTDRVFAEIDWLRTAAAIVPGHVPQVLGVDEPLGAFVMEMLPASEHANWKAELLAGRPHAEAGAQMGDLLGRLHASTSRDAALAQRFANDANFFALRLDPYLLETARQNPDLSGELVALVHTTQTNAHALVHGDVSPKNILLGMHGPVLLDAECAWWGDPAFDLAFLLNHMLLKSVRLPWLARDCAALFTGITDAHVPHVSWEPPHAFEARAAALLPALLLARVDGKSPVEYLSEAQRAQVRAVARPLVREPRQRLRDVLALVQATLPETGVA